MFEIVTIGELLIDFTPYGSSSKGNQIFECNPGGAPGNVLAAAAKLGLKTSFIGKVGQDQFGKLLKETLESICIDTSGLIMTKEYNTTLALIHLTADGDRSFSFYRKPGADMMITKDEVNYDLIKMSKIFHFGSISMTTEPSREATLEAVKCAKESKKLISYDPNLRIDLWDSLVEAKRVMISMMKYADILKISYEELEFLTGYRDLEEGSLQIYNEYGVKLILITLGREGFFFRSNCLKGRGYAYNVKTIDTTAAGDSFLGAVMYELLKRGKNIVDYSEGEFGEIFDFAGALSSLVTTKFGGIHSMPSIEEVYRCMKEMPKLRS